MVEYENLKVETGCSLTQCNEDDEEILVLWGKFKGKEKVSSDAGLHKPFL